MSQNPSSRTAGTIDTLASYLKADPNAAEKAGDVLESAKGDLAALVDRIEAVKEEERTALAATLNEQTRKLDHELKIQTELIDEW